MAPYIFSPDDMQFPVYCIGCRNHIPRIVSNSGRGYCPNCLLAQQAAQANAAQVAAASAQQAAQAQQAHAMSVYNVSTGLGFCPQCRSGNVVQFDSHSSNVGQKNGLGAASLLCLVVGVLTLCVGVGIFFLILGGILFAYGLFVPNRAKIGTSRACQYCGFRWQV